MKFENCYKCGKRKLAIINIDRDFPLTVTDVEMYLMTYGKHKGSYACKDCKVQARKELI